MLWANLVLLFWLSLLPFATEWMSKNGFAALPVAVYGCVLLLPGSATTSWDARSSVRSRTTRCSRAAVGHDAKGIASLCIYAAAIPTTLLSRWVALGGYVIVAIMWPRARSTPRAEHRGA